MTLTLPLATQEWPLFRLLTRATWGSDITNPWTSGADWTVEAMEGGTDGATPTDGYYLLGYDRVCLPMIGRAQFVFRYGRINGGAVTAPDLSRHEVRIQAAPRPASGDPAWRTVWTGTVETQEDSGWPGSDEASGERIYHCADSLFRMSRWMIERHGFAATDGTTTIKYEDCVGHPGYNVGKGRDSRLAGNRWSTDADTWTTDGGLEAHFHTIPGAAGSVAWTDLKVLGNAQKIGRRFGEPVFPPTGPVGHEASLGQLDGESAWEIRPGESCLDLHNRILKRERGKGLAFLDWLDDSGDPSGPLTVLLRIHPQLPGISGADVVTYTDPSTGSDVTLYTSYDGATNFGVDLIGDHRLVDSAFKLGDKDQYTIDALETVGEPIEVLVTLSFVDSPSGSAPNVEGHTLRRRWSTSEQTTFRGRTSAQRADERFKPVYQQFGLPVVWDFKAGNGNNATLRYTDYRCNGDDTGITTPGVVNGTILGDNVLGSREPTSLLLTELLTDLPVYEGFDYRVDAATKWDAGSQRALPVRRKPLVMLRVASDKYVKLSEVLPGIQFSIDGHDLWLVNPVEESGARPISDPSLSSLGALATLGDYRNLVITVALRLPYRVRLYTGLIPTDPACRRRPTIYHPDHHLWLAHPGAIWDLDGSAGSTSTGHAGRRAAGAGTADAPGILRDDRSALARMHYLTWAWYGSARRTATWALRCCGSLSSFEAYDGSGISGSPSAKPYPTLGAMITSMAANGESHQINTPVTRIAYDNGSGITTWSTDWNELEFER